MRAADDVDIVKVRWNTVTSREEALAHIQQVVIPQPWRCSICLHDRSIGYISVRPGPHIGYAIESEHWGLGFATVALEMVVPCVFESFSFLKCVEIVFLVLFVGLIHLVLADFPSPKRCLLLLKVASSKDTIQRLKEKIQRKQQDDARLRAHGERIVAAECSGLRVVAQYGAEKILMKVSVEDNVGELRKKLQKMNMNLPQEKYFFIYKQIVMDDVSRIELLQEFPGY